MHMELVSILQMQKADKYTIEVLGIPGKILMQKAASAICKEVVNIAEGKNTFSAAIFCGPGNNGGDGWATASILYEANIDVSVFSGCSLEKLKGDAAFYANKAVENGINIKYQEMPGDLSDYDVAIDAIFGIGLQREVSDIYKEYILLINNKARFVISVDVPSGLYSDEGVPHNFAVKAERTVTFGKAKVMLFSQPGCTYAGKVIVDDIGIPDEAYSKEGFRYIAVNSAFVREFISQRKKISSKGNYGRVLLVTGSPGMTGATGLCAESCLRSGTGLVYCAVPKNKVYEYDSLVREAISIPVETGGLDYVSSSSKNDIIKAVTSKTAVVIGPGLSNESDSHLILSALFDNTEVPIIVDAQTINDLSENMYILKKAGGNTIFTPHPGEMSGLLGKSIESIQNNRLSSAVEFAREHDVIVLLKGHRTVVTDGNHVYINTTGNPGMATAGSGDVLCGVIASCTAIVDDKAKAAAVAAYIHGAAGDRAAVRFGEYSMKSGDIITEIPWIMKNITGV
ncbi:MAG: NAD(P)H-hydrate dehydratase [Clostridiales bacterium]|nr:NAD(P)H-hydrate dehydratase [Clostridiales bacterium]